MIGNEIYGYLDVLLFCPTRENSSIVRLYSFSSSLKYCSRMEKTSLKNISDILTIGNDLHPDIDIFWISKTLQSTSLMPINKSKNRLSVSHIFLVNGILQRVTL